MIKGDLLVFYSLYYKLTNQKLIELSQRKNKENHEVAFEQVLHDFEECLAKTNLSSKEVFSSTEVTNFLVKLTNNMLITSEKLFKTCQEYYKHIMGTFQNGFFHKLSEDVRNGLQMSNISTAVLPKSKLEMTMKASTRLLASIFESIFGYLLAN